MAYAERAYRLDAFPASSPERSRSADVRAVRTGTRGKSTANDELLVTAAKMAAIVMVVIAVLSFARIALTNAAVATMIESDAVSAQITDARTSGVSLEMEQSVLSSTSALNAAVKRLGMVAPAEVGTLVLAPDVVATDAEGSLLLSDSVKNLVSAQV